MTIAFDQGGHFILHQIYGCFTVLGRGWRKKIDFSVLHVNVGPPYYDQLLTKSMFSPINVQCTATYCPILTNDQTATIFCPQLQCLTYFLTTQNPTNDHLSPTQFKR